MTHRSRGKLAAIALGLGLLLSGGLNGLGQVIDDRPPIIIWPPVPHPIFKPIEISKYTVTIEVHNQLAHVSIEQVFFNPNERTLEGAYLFPLPDGAVLSSLTLCSEDGCLEGKLLNADEARQIYHDIVRKTLDPALLEYVGERAFQVRAFPIPAHGERKVRLSYEQLLERSGDLVQLVYPLAANEQVKQFVLGVTIKADDPIGNIYSPSHNVSVQKTSEREARVSFETSALKSGQDFVLYYTLTHKALGMDVLTYRPEGEDGYFTLLIRPVIEGAGQILPKDIVFVFDISGSMSGEKIEQAKQSLKHAIGRLSEEDRLGLIVFSDVLQAFQPGLVPVKGLNRDELFAFIDHLSAGGSTDINQALLKGLSYFEDNARLKALVFLTDGEPTAGETEPAKIIKNATDKNIRKAQLFVFGVGYDVNAKLLDRLSAENGGFSTYVEPGESIEREIAQFYERVGAPLLTGLELDFRGLQAYDLYPKKLPDLFKGSQIQVLGRYKESGSGRVTLKAHRGSEDFSMAFDMDFTAQNQPYVFLPRIWAARKIGYLLEQIRLLGEKPELVDEVKRLATQYGIVTPYTSYLADEAERKMLSPLALQQNSGKQAVQMSQRLMIYRDATSANVGESTQIRQLGDRAFMLKDGVWSPTNYTGQKTLKVKFGSEAYFWLIDHWSVGAYLALGKAVIFPWQDRFVQISEADGLSRPEAIASLGTLPPDKGQSSRGSPWTIAAVIMGVALVIILVNAVMRR